jgi:hypothetical protein
MVSLFDSFRSKGVQATRLTLAAADSGANIALADWNEKEAFALLSELRSAQ